MEELKKHPPWKETVNAIVCDVEERGYGIFYAHEELKQMLSISEAKTIEDFQYIRLV